MQSQRRCLHARCTNWLICLGIMEHRFGALGCSCPTGLQAELSDEQEHLTFCFPGRLSRQEGDWESFITQTGAAEGPEPKTISCTGRQVSACLRSEVCGDKAGGRRAKARACGGRPHLPEGTALQRRPCALLKPFPGEVRLAQGRWAFLVSCLRSSCAPSRFSSGSSSWGSSEAL